MTNALDDRSYPKYDRITDIQTDGILSEVVNPGLYRRCIIESPPPVIVDHFVGARQRAAGYCQPVGHTWHGEVYISRALFDGVRNREGIAASVLDTYLHEAAHRLTPKDPGHGPVFLAVAMLLYLRQFGSVVGNVSLYDAQDFDATGHFQTIGEAVDWALGWANKHADTTMTAEAFSKMVSTELAAMPTRREIAKAKKRADDAAKGVTLLLVVAALILAHHLLFG